MMCRNIQGAVYHTRREMKNITERIKAIEDNMSENVDLVRLSKIYTDTKEASCNTVESSVDTVDYTNVAHLFRFQIEKTPTEVTASGSNGFWSKYLRVEGGGGEMSGNVDGGVDAKMVLVTDAIAGTPVFLTKIPNEVYTTWVGKVKTTMITLPVS